MSRNKSKRNIPPILLRKNAPKLKLPPKVEVKKPKVSVVLTSYNHAAYIGAAIESVLNQTFTDFELFIVDDGSTDNSREIISSYDDPRIKTFLYKENRGPRLALAEAAAATQGKYIAIHHSDDLWRNDKLQKQVEFLDANEEYAACFTWVDFIDENGNIQNLPDGNLYKGVFDKENRTRAEWLNYFFYKSNCLCHPSLMIHRDAYRKYNLLATNGFWQLPDYLMWIRLCFNAEIFILQERLTKFRLRQTTQENISNVSYDKRVRISLENYLVTKQFLDGFKDDKFFLEVFPEAKNYIIDGEFNRNFAFSELCLKKEDPECQLAAIEILKNLLSDNETAAQIKKLYDYDEKSFFVDTGKYDIFNLVQRFSMLKGCLYFDTGKDFNADESFEKIIFVDGKGKFFGKYVFTSDKPITKLRFDPGDDIISLRIESVKINGVEQKNFTAPFAKYEDKFYNFLIFDPQFIFSCENLTGEITFEILGEIDRNYPIKFNRFFYERENQIEHQISALHTEITRLSQQIKDLERVNLDINSLNVELNARIENLNTQINDITAENHRLKETINEIFNSNSWKITKPLRKIGSLFKKF